MKSTRTCGAVIALTAGLASAGSLFSNGPALYDNGSANFTSGNELAQWLQTEDFTLSANASVGSATFSLLNTIVGNNNANWDGGLQWWIFDSAGTTPGNVIATGNAQNVSVNYVTTSGFDFYDVAFDFGTGVALSANTQYFFGLHMANDFDSRDELYWGSTNFNNTGTGQESDGGTMDNWVDNGTEHAFTLGPVPAPGTAVLLGLGGLVGARRRR